jgi:hypothetical protein
MQEITADATGLLPDFHWRFDDKTRFDALLNMFDHDRSAARGE